MLLLDVINFKILTLKIKHGLGKASDTQLVLHSLYHHRWSNWSGFPCESSLQEDHLQPWLCGHWRHAPGGGIQSPWLPGNQLHEKDLGCRRIYQIHSHQVRESPLPGQENELQIVTCSRWRSWRAQGFSPQDVGGGSLQSSAMSCCLSHSVHRILLLGAVCPRSRFLVIVGSLF